MQKRILVVEDDTALRFLFNNVLTSSGCQVTEADSCASAFAAIDQAGDFDFILCDVELTDCAALDLIDQCCKRNLTTVVISANDDYLNPCREMGVLAFIRKPITARDLLQVVNNIDELDRPYTYIATRHGRHLSKPDAAEQT